MFPVESELLGKRLVFRQGMKRVTDGLAQQILESFERVLSLLKVREWIHSDALSVISFVTHDVIPLDYEQKVNLDKVEQFELTVTEFHSGRNSLEVVISAHDEDFSFDLRPIVADFCIELPFVPRKIALRDQGEWLEARRRRVGCTFAQENPGFWASFKPERGIWVTPRESKEIRRQFGRKGIAVKRVA